jgi:hypothetical protein
VLYTIYGQDNDLYFFQGRADVARCPACGQLTRKWSEDLLVVPIAKRVRLDASYSYDGVFVVSNRFKEVYAAGQMTGLQFSPLSNGMHWIMPTRTVAFDAAARGTRFERKCGVCHSYAAIAGAAPAFLIQPVTVAPLELVRTDIEFGSGDEQSPVVVCGERAASLLRDAALTGLDIEAVRES